MTDPVEPLILDLLEWVSARPRTYEETMDAWRTSCPRLPVWEEANDRNWIAETDRDGRRWIQITPAGQAQLASVGRVA